MSNKVDPFIDKWGKTREKGLLKYIISSGLSFGILLFIVLSAWNYFSNNEVYSDTYDFLIQLVICIVFGGGVYGLITWFMNEHLYKKKTNLN